MGNPKTRQNALVVLGFGAVMLVAGAVVGLVPYDSVCGSAFFGLEGTTTNGLDEAICSSRHAGVTQLAIGLLILGALVVIIAGVTAAAARPAISTGARGQSVADELTSLAALRGAGELSADEYTAAKAKLLGA